jgi:hypothetical protein
MNILTDALPDCVTVGGREYAVKTDFRACLKVILAFEDNDLTPQEKAFVLLSLFPDPPQDAAAALEAASRFLNGAEIDSDENQERPRNDEARVYSFSKDAGYIFAAFRQTHGIDLQKASLHWWEFLTLFMDLGGETTFCQLANLRRRVKSGKATKEERRAARDLGDVFDLPEVDTRTLEEKEAGAAFDGLWKGSQ